MTKILVVEDDAATAVVVSDLLRDENYNVDIAHDGNEALDYLNTAEYDLLVLDRQLPGVSGKEVCLHYRKRSRGPVLMLTGMGTVADRVEGLEAGADDYLTKPFDARELLARIRALLRRASDFMPEVVILADISINFRSRIVSKEGKAINLTPREFEVLDYFIKHANEVVSPDVLLRRVWQSDSDASPHAVYTCINRLRKHLNAADKEAIIKTVHGVGYRLEN